MNRKIHCALIAISMKNFQFIFILQFLVISYSGYSQNWEKWYAKEDYYVTNYSIQEHYDFGYLIAGNILDFDNSKSYPWIIKTNVNGDTIWSKILLSSEYIGVEEILTTADGGFLFAGGINRNGSYEPYVSKFNVCGQKEWCTIFTSENGNSSAKSIVELANGNIGVLINQLKETETLHVFNLDENGNKLWEKAICSIENHPHSRIPWGNKIKSVNNESFLIAGHVYWKNPWDELYPIRSFFALVNKDGIEKWVLPFGLNDSIHSHALNVIEKTNGNFIGLGAKWTNSNSLPSDILNKDLQFRNVKDIEFRNGLIMEFDKNGAEINHFIADFENIDTSFKFQVFSNLFYTDSVAIISGIFSDNKTFLNVGEIITDTSFYDENFNVYFRMKHENAYDKFDHSMTSDHKILCSATDRFEDDWRMSLTKLNRNLEQDSINTGNYEYDYLCDQEIESGSIFIGDCDVIINVDEVPTPEQYRINKSKVQVSVSPNPALDNITISFGNTEDQQKLELCITSSLGQQVYKTKLIKGQTELIVSLNDWQKGVYLVQVYSSGKIVGNNRFVKI